MDKWEHFIMEQKKQKMEAMKEERVLNIKSTCWGMMGLTISFPLFFMAVIAQQEPITPGWQALYVLISVIALLLLLLSAMFLGMGIGGLSYRWWEKRKLRREGR